MNTNLQNTITGKAPAYCQICIARCTLELCHPLHHLRRNASCQARQVSLKRARHTWPSCETIQVARGNTHPLAQNAWHSRRPGSLHASAGLHASCMHHHWPLGCPHATPSPPGPVCNTICLPAPRMQLCWPALQGDGMQMCVDRSRWRVWLATDWILRACVLSLFDHRRGSHAMPAQSARSACCRMHQKVCWTFKRVLTWSCPAIFNAAVEVPMLFKFLQ